LASSIVIPRSNATSGYPGKRVLLLAAVAPLRMTDLGDVVNQLLDHLAAPA